MTSGVSVSVARLESLLSRAIAAETDAAGVEVEATFAELGLDSLGAVSVAKCVGKEIGVEIAPILLYEFPTVNALARHLAEELLPSRDSG
ncbi:acyl carrier protein [Rhizohabitans arisaemae]|uniref:acyl carrier protein n=1 Tax=Rhizohabitans arisaemae TaxID=2720610 RepID=UPI0024B0DAEF|nr:acyl carrier protein [Rhizohabitans arisaemae]